MTEAGKNLIVKTHNELRQRVAAGLETHGNQPGASNMMKLVWNDEIAATAQRWADQCKGARHDKVRRKCDATAVGQNIFLTTGFYYEESILPEAVKGWYNEVVQPKPGGEINPFPSSNIQPFK